MASASYHAFFLTSHLLLLVSLAEKKLEINPRCPSFPCGNLGDVNFPFSNRTHPECGLCIVDYCTEPIQSVQLGKDGSWFYISSISQDNTVLLQDKLFQKDLHNSSCEPLKNLTLPRSPFFSIEASSKGNLFKCQFTHNNIPPYFNEVCNFSSNSSIYSGHPSNNSPSPPAHCSVFHPRVTKTNKSIFVHDIYAGFFLLQVNVTTECLDCHFRGGQCQIDINGNFICPGAKTVNVTKECLDCYSKRGQCLTDSNGKFQCSGSKTGHGKKILMGLTIGTDQGRSIMKVAVAATVSGVGILIIILVLCFRKKNSSNNSMAFWRKETKNYQNIEAFIRNYGSLAPKRYSYSQIKKMTNSFEVKLGQGGYGGVYKGRLHDGRDVAVKLLNESKGNGEEFINEVASISRTSHVNVVGLFGYCFQGRKRALIYEFVPNGSLEKFIYQKIPNYKQLKWEKLYQIAVGIAQGLEYLHRGCNTRILHFDIKPHNILLDKDFRPKISDFGLAKIFPGRESIIPMTGARGTIGYIAPEVCCREFGEVSHKSDVYSYGMMVLEMAGGRKNVDVGVGRTSEIYFPHWVYERLEVDEELGLQGIENEEDKESARKMIIVSLWCIQTNPSSRPAMNRVVEMLEGSLDSLRIPPKPVMYSSRSQSQAPDSSASSSLIY